MVEMLERFVAAIESIAHSYAEDVAARLGRMAENIEAALPPVKTVDAPPATVIVKRGRKPKAEPIETAPGPKSEPGDKILKNMGIETKLGDPGHKYEIKDVNEALQAVALHPAIGHAKAKEIFAAHANGAAKLRDCDPGVFEPMWKACKEALDAAE